MDRFAQAVWPVVGVVTALTIAQSIALALALEATGALWLWQSPTIVEPAIAVTITLAAFDDLHPVYCSKRPS